jgi:FG-GAP-like repeat/FG-GAP repeat
VRLAFLNAVVALGLLAVSPLPTLAITVSEIAVLRGAAAGDGFGSAVASAGDVNGDGYPDIIVGSISTDERLGYAKVYFGGANLDSIPDLTLVTSFPDRYGNDFYGRIVSGAGDVNGDGYDDLLVSASGSAGTAPYTAVFLYYGGPQPDEIADLIFMGEPFFGYALAVGDLNADGYSDLVIGFDVLPVSHDGGVGGVHIYYGGPSMDTQPDVTILGEFEGDNFGLWVSAPGDVNCDGYNDLMVGARNAGPEHIGLVYVFYGGATGPDTTPDLRIPSSTGRSFAAGDLDRDGCNDVIALNFYTWDGTPWLYYGGVSLDSIPDLALDDTFTLPFRVGDMNLDYYEDLVLYRYPWGIEFLFGAAEMDSSVDAALISPHPGNAFGVAVAPLGDIDGDGFQDMIIGAPNDDVAGANAGCAYVYSVRPPGIPVTVEAIPAESGQGSLSLKLLSAPGATPIRVAVGDSQPRGDEQMSVYDIQGRLVQRMTRGSLVWDCERGGVRVSSGVYFLRVTAGTREGVLRALVAR